MRADRRNARADRVIEGIFSAQEREVLKHIEGAKSMGKEILLPKARSLSDLFPKIVRVADISPGRYKARILRKRGARGGAVTSYCGVPGGILDVDARKEVLDAIDREMLTEDYHISFQIVPRGSVCLVTASYDRIIGSRWLAIVESHTVPGLKSEPAREPRRHSCTRCGKPGHNRRTCKSAAARRT